MYLEFLKVRTFAFVEFLFEVFFEECFYAPLSGLALFDTPAPVSKKILDMLKAPNI